MRFGLGERCEMEREREKGVIVLFVEEGISVCSKGLPGVCSLRQELRDCCCPRCVLFESIAAVIG